MTFSGITKNQQQQQQQHQPVAPQVLEDEVEEVDDGLPLWKKALMKKRKEEQKKKNQELKQKVVKMSMFVLSDKPVWWTPSICRVDQGLSTSKTLCSEIDIQYENVLRCIINNDAGDINFARNTNE